LELGSRHPEAIDALSAWAATTRAATWRSLRDVRETYRHADGVKLKDQRVVTVFNIKGNKYRLITAIDYPLGIVNVLLFLTHAEYSKDLWKGKP
jgi:mRNA interferase HigB